MLDRVDVVIIGAGASGGAVAWSLAETKMRIVCLEQGDWVKPPTTPPMAATGGPGAGRLPLQPQPPRPGDGLPDQRGQLAGQNRQFQRRRRRHNPVCRTLSALSSVGFPRAFARRAADDWPIDYNTLEPYYAENDRMTGVSGLAGDPAYPPKQPMMPPLPLGKSAATLARGLNKLGWHWWPSDSAIASTDYEGRGKCINLGNCVGGCAQGRKRARISHTGRTRSEPESSFARGAG